MTGTLAEIISLVPEPIRTTASIAFATLTTLATIAGVRVLVGALERLAGLLVGEIEAEAADEAAPVRRRRDERTVGERRRRRA